MDIVYLPTSKGSSIELKVSLKTQESLVFCGLELQHMTIFFNVFVFKNFKSDFT